MRQWRAGSFSLALILVLLGVGLLVDRFSGAPKALELVVTWWPLALILLGTEILAAGFLPRSEQFPLKYDGWSIFLLVVLFFFGLGSYALSSSGMIAQIQEALAISDYPCTIPDQKVDLAGIKKIVLSTHGGALEIRNGAGEELTILGQATIPAVSAEAAARMAEQGRAGLKTVGDTLYIRIDAVPTQHNIFRHNSSRCERTIFIPAVMPLEVTGSGFMRDIVMINLDSYEASWSIDHPGPVRVNLSRDLDLTLSGSVSRSGENLTGNAAWEYPSAEDPDRGSHQKTTGTVTLGQGRRPLVISSDEWIEVNLRPRVIP